MLRPLAYACCPSPLRSVVIYDHTTIASLFEAFLSWVLQLERKGFPFLKFLEFCFSIGYDNCQSRPVSFSTACLVSVWTPCLLLSNLPLLALAAANYFLSLILKMSTVPQGSKSVINVLPIFQATQPELVRKQNHQRPSIPGLPEERWLHDHWPSEMSSLSIQPFLTSEDPRTQVPLPTLY